MYTEFGSSGGIVRVPMIWETSSQSSCMGNEHKKQPEATQGPPLYVRTYLEVYIGSRPFESENFFEIQICL